MAHQRRQHRNQSQKNRACEGQARHCEIKKISRRFSWSYARDITAVFFQIVRDLRRLKLRSNPKIAEEENHPRQNNIVRPAGGKRAGDSGGSGTIPKAVADDGGREQKQCPGKNDRHYASIVYFQGHILGLATVHFPAHDPLGVLHSDFAYALSNRDHSGNDNK